MPYAIKKIAKKPPKKTGNDEMFVYNELKESIARRQKTLLAWGAAAVAVIALAAGLFIHHAITVDRANRYNARGYAVFYGLSPQTPAPGPARYGQALSWFEKAYAERASAYSLYYIGASQYELGQYGPAVKALTSIAAHYPGDAQFVPLSLYKTAMIELREGRQDQALKYFGMMEKSPFDAFKDVAYYEDARLLAIMGKKDAAAMKIEDLIHNFPQSPYAVEAETAQARKQKTQKAPANNSGIGGGAPKGLPEQKTKTSGANKTK